MFLRSPRRKRLGVAEHLSWSCFATKSFDFAQDFSKDTELVEVLSFGGYAGLSKNFF